jgi:sporulation protein YlmC with PRC-barrel domain
MIQFYRNVVAAPVLHYDDRSLIALIKDVIIDPDTGKLEALWVKPAKHPLSYGVIQMQDIAEWKKNVYVKRDDVVADPADIIKLADILSQKREVLGNSVQTEAGETLGKVADIDFDTETGYLRHLYVEKLFLGCFSYSRRIFDYESVIEILPDRILVKGIAEKKIPNRLLKDKPILMDG